MATPIMAEDCCSENCKFTRIASSVYQCVVHKAVHNCGKECQAPKHETGAGTYCKFTGVETAGASEVLYSNPLQRDSYSRRSGGVHWNYQKSTTRRFPTAHANEAARCRQHTSARITTALRKIFSSTAYGQFIDKEKNRRRTFIENAVGKSKRQRLTFTEVALLTKTVIKKFSGATKLTLPITDKRLEVIRESLIVYSRGAYNEKPLLHIKSTPAYVAAVLTLLSSGLKVNGEEAFPKLLWLQSHMPPPVAMTYIGVPCRSVSLAVRQLKKHVFGPDFKGVRNHFFRLARSRNLGASH